MIKSTSGMTPRERMLATFAGQPVDCFPVTAPYLMLAQADHWTEITNRPSWTYYQWCLQDPEEHTCEFHRFHDLLPFDISEPEHWCGSRDFRLHARIEQEGEDYYRIDGRTGVRTRLVLNLHEKEQSHEYPRTVFSPKEAEKRISIRSYQEIHDSGEMDYVADYIRTFGGAHFVNGSMVNSFYMSSLHVGLANRFALLLDDPELMHAVIERHTLSNIERIHAYAAIGCDAVFIDDAAATKDMVSPNIYREFSLPYLKRQIDAIHNHGMRAILIYFGGIADRVEEIVSAGADALMMETSMKGYTNDLETIAAQVNDRMLMFGNLDPIGDVEQKSDEALAEAMARQIAVGKRYGRFVVSTGSPITPNTSLSRMQKYIELGHTLSAF